jgi:HK97 family phage portal protein
MFEWIKSLFDPVAVVPELRGIQTFTATDYGRDILVNTPDGWEHDQQYLWWVDGPGGGQATGFGNPPPNARFSGADALPAVLRCTAIIADTIAGLPWRVYRGFDQQPTPRFITDPQMLREDRRVFPVPIVADAMSNVEFYTQWITSALWYGDGIAYAQELDASGQPRTPLILLDPEQVKIKPAERYTGMRYSYWHGDIELDSARVLRLRGEPPYENGSMGTGVLDRFSSDLGLAAAMRTYAAGIFTNGIPSGYLKVNAPQVTETQAADLQTKWMSRHGSPRKRIAVLNATTDFVPLSISPVDSGLSEAKTWSLRDIALAFGVPAYMLGVPGDSSTYANVESRMTELRTFTLLPWIRRIEATLDALFPFGTEVKIVTDGTLRADTSTRYAAYETALRGGWMTVDEVRALEDRPPLPQQVSTAPEDTLPGVTGDDLAQSQGSQVQADSTSVVSA